MNRLVRRMGPLLMIAFLLNACSSAAPSVKHDNPLVFRTTTPHQTAQPQNIDSLSTDVDVFQKPDGLETAVDFWRKTFATWQRSEVIFHDDRYLDVIYEVMVVPGDVDESLTSEQKEMVNQRRDYWKIQLAVLENKLRYNYASLNANISTTSLYLNTDAKQRQKVVSEAFSGL